MSCSKTKYLYICSVNYKNIIIMITREEFLKALETVKNYEIQISEQFEEMKKILRKKDFNHLAITKETFIRDAGLSMRALNCTENFLREHNLSFKIGSLEGFKRRDFMMYRLFGKKSLDELEMMLFKVGIVLE